jgi:hypothetical protein
VPKKSLTKEQLKDISKAATKGIAAVIEATDIVFVNPIISESDMLKE